MSAASYAPARSAGNRAYRRPIRPPDTDLSARDQQLAAAFTALTRRAATPKVVGLLRRIDQVHGAASIAVLAREFRAGGEWNLLARAAQPTAGPRQDEEPTDEELDAAAAAVRALLPPVPGPGHWYGAGTGDGWRPLTPDLIAAPHTAESVP